ncbi:hypothetical protein ACFVMA_18925 [Streptomyces rochei]|nr:MULTISPECIES: hypothetical protein [unclassified Streptomyces]MDN3258091.1 hypothetical protein [Streptomyces sp. MA25(2023)]
MTQVGRPQGELKGETPQANDLAQWLRTLTRGVSQRDLAQLLHIGKTLCSEYLNGSKLIPEDMIGQLVDAYVTDNRLREQRKAAGHLRRQRAVEAAQGKPSMPPLSQRARTPTELQLRLDDARRGQLAAQEKTFQAARLVDLLLNLVASLQERCARLEAERERAASLVRGELQRELEQSEIRLESARTLLEEARREREQAEEIRLAAHHMVERERQAFKDAEEEPHPAADAEDAAEPGARALRLEDLGLAALHDVDRVLDASSAQLASQAQELEALGEHVGLAPRVHTTPQTPAIARDLPAGNTANPPASSNTGRDRAAAEWEAARRQALANVATAMNAAHARRQAAAVPARRARTAPGGNTDETAESVYANWDSPLLRGVEGNPRHHTVDKYDTFTAVVHALRQLERSLPGVQDSGPQMLRLRIDDADNELFAQRDFWVKIARRSTRYRLTAEPVALLVSEYRRRKARGDRLGRSSSKR